MDRVLLTTAGSERLWQELEHLKHEKRPRVIEAIAEARAHGDLSRRMRSITLPESSRVL